MVPARPISLFEALSGEESRQRRGPSWVWVQGPVIARSQFCLLPFDIPCLLEWDTPAFRQLLPEALDEKSDWSVVPGGFRHSQSLASQSGSWLSGPQFWSQLYGSTDFDSVPISGTIPLLNPIDPISSGATQVEDVPRLPPSTYGSNPTSSQSRSKTGRRRRRSKKVREPLHNLINYGGVSSNADPWTRMTGLVQQALTGETSAVCAAAQHANLLLPDAESGSLAWWLCKEVLAASKVFDHTSFLLILRGLETMRKSRPCGSGTLRVTCCNLTTWRREVKQWLVNQGEVLLVQEHHLLGPSLPEEISSMGGLGYDSFLVPACPGEGRHNSSHGGIGIFVKSHLGARFRGQFVKQGCRYVAVTLRRLGADLTVVSLCLQSSSGFGSHVNSAILASLRSFRDQVKGPFLVGGDWNSPLPELQDTSLFESLSLLPLGTGHPTCGDNELDYLGVSPYPPAWKV